MINHHRRHAINPPLNIYKKLALSFIILTAVLLGIIFYYTFSYAYITITPKSEAIATDFNFVVVQDTKAVNLNEGIFLGRIINQTVEGDKTFDATGSKAVTGSAVGQVKITNNLSRPQALVATTRLLTSDNILYRLSTKVIVPANGSVETTVYPDNPSQKLAISGTKFTIPGLNKNTQTLVFAVALNDFKIQGTVKAVSQTDLDKAVTALSDEIEQKVLTSDDANKVQILQNVVLEKSFNHKAGDVADNFSLHLALKVTGVIFDDQPVKDFATKALASMVPEDKQLSQTNSDSLAYDVEKYDFNNHSVQLKSDIKGTIIISESSPILAKDKLVKLSADQLKSYLENFQDIQSVDVTFFPSWLNRMPSFSDHIIIRINK